MLLVITVKKERRAELTKRVLIGSLLGDVFIHLLPHAFSKHQHNHHDQNNEHKHILVGISTFAGLFIFYASDKIMRSMYGNKSHSHSHKDQKEKKGHEKIIQASTYLNLLADFTHNLTDGIAMAASFYASPAVGATTTIAVFFHEIPHEVSDYAILIKSGFSKKRAMMAQFTTAIGAYIGTLIGIFIEETAIQFLDHHHRGLLGTDMTWGDLTIPITAGGFIYIATVGVMPELLGHHHSKLQALKELTAMISGIGLMAIISWKEPHHH